MYGLLPGGATATKTWKEDTEFWPNWPPKITDAHDEAIRKKHAKPLFEIHICRIFRPLYIIQWSMNNSYCDGTQWPFLFQEKTTLSWRHHCFEHIDEKSMEWKPSKPRGRYWRQNLMLIYPDVNWVSDDLHVYIPKIGIWAGTCVVEYESVVIVIWQRNGDLSGFFTWFHRQKWWN